MRRTLRRLALVLLAIVVATGAAHADEIFVVSTNNGTIGEYTTSGQLVNPALISGLVAPQSIAISGSQVFVANQGGAGTVSEYTTSGATVNPALISGLVVPTSIAVSGSDLFVTNQVEGAPGFGTI